MLRLIVTVGLLLCYRAVADVSESYPSYSYDFGRPKAERLPEPTGTSIAPLLGYDPTFGFVAGGAFFHKSEHVFGGFSANTNFKKVYQVHPQFQHDINENWFYGFRGGVINGYQPYYGEGGDTKAADFKQIWGYHSKFLVEVAYRVSPIYSVGILSDVRFRTEEPGENSPANRIAPNETSVGIGLFQDVDARDNKMSPREGFRLRSEILVMPPDFTTVSGQVFGQVRGDLIVYKEILNEIVDDFVAAIQLSGGFTIGDPTYAFRYKLGGADYLHGYYDNRFRGNKFYTQQSELRFPLWKLFSGAAYLGFGDATDTQFSFAKMSYGVGLRIGLPPDWVNKIRIDYGVGHDQVGIFANFGQTF